MLRQAKVRGELIDVCDDLFAEFLFAGRHRHQPGICAKPVALIEEQEKKPVIIQLSDAAGKRGFGKE